MHGRTAPPEGDVSGLDFLPFSDNEESVRADVELIRQSPYMPEGTTVSGYICDVETGKLQTVVAAGN